MLAHSRGADSAPTLIHRLVTSAGAKHIMLTAQCPADSQKPEERGNLQCLQFLQENDSTSPFTHARHMAHPLDAGGTNKAIICRDAEHWQQGMSHEQRHQLRW